MEERYLTPEEVAMRFAVHPRTIKKWCREGQIKAEKIGPSGIWRIPISAIDDLHKVPSKVRKMAVAISKGGTGKTTTAVNLSHGLALRGLRVLVVDTDTQGQVSKSLGVDPEYGLTELLLNEQPIEKILFAARENLKIISCNQSLIEVKRNITDKKAFRSLFAKSLESIEKQFDYIILDTGPGYDEMAIAVLNYAKEIIIPIQPQPLHLFGIMDFLELINMMQGINPSLQISYVLPTIVKLGLKAEAESLDLMRNKFQNLICDPIKENVKLHEAPAHGKSIFEYDSSSTGAQDYKTFIDRVVSHV